MRKILPWGLWLWISLVIVAAFAPQTRAVAFIGESSRILFFHVPMAWASFVAFMAAGVWSLLYLARGRRPDHDRAAVAAVELGLLFCVLATVTGSMWSRVEWGAFWNWDPRQSSIVLALIYYAAYVTLRGSIADAEVRRRLAAAFAVLGLVMAPFLFFVAPRVAGFTLHPEPVINTEGKMEMSGPIALVLFASSLGFTVLFFWLHNLQRRILALAEGGARPAGG